MIKGKDMKEQEEEEQSWDGLPRRWMKKSKLLFGERHGGDGQLERYESRRSGRRLDGNCWEN